MKLARFSGGNGPELAVLRDMQELVPLNRDSQEFPRDMTDLIARWDEFEGPAREMAANASSIPLELDRLLAPIATPGKMLAIGLNYADHIAESGMETPKDQVWFCKHINAANGPYSPIQIPHVSTMVDYEAELVVVIGSGGKHITTEEAPGRIFGYCVGNDVSVRDWQWQTPQWMLGKSFDTHAPFGPWIVTADEIGDPHRLGIRALVNGDVRQDSNTRHLVFNVWDQLAHLSKAMTLSSGDLIFTGTPGGVGAATKDWLKHGDSVRIEIDKIGAIEGICENEG